MNLAFPYSTDASGRTRSAGDPEHVRDLIEQVLFTSPGERVNRPTFGSGLLQTVFAPNGTELAAATQFLVQGALQQWLGDVIEVQAVQVQAEEAQLRVQVSYVIRQTQQSQTALFAPGGAP